MLRLAGVLGILALWASVAAGAPPVWPHAQGHGEGPLPPPPGTDVPSCLHETLDAWRESTHAPGVTLAVAFEGDRVIGVASGVSNKARLTAMKPTDRMPTGSAGKTFCAAVTLQLIEESGKDPGEFLDTKLSHWLGARPWFLRLPNANTVTLRNLMQHSSGIPEHVQSDVFIRALAKDPQKAWTPEELIVYSLDQPALFDAGQGWSYADTNFILVGMVIEQVTGASYYDEVARRILKPRGLKDTIPQDRPDLPGLISGYTGKGNPFPVPEEVAIDGRYAINPQFEWTGGGMVTTAVDLARWGRMLYGGDVLNEPTRALMLTGVKAKTGPADEYGLGVQMYPTRHGQAVGHSGWFPGYLTVMAYYPDRNVSVAVQVNTDIRPGALRLRALLDRAVDCVVEFDAKDAPAPPPPQDPPKE